jgi:hypothetical protein
MTFGSRSTLVSMVFVAVSVAACSKTSPSPSSTGAASDLPAAEPEKAAAPPLAHRSAELTPSKECNDFIAKVPNVGRATCSATEEVLFEKDHTGDCLRCAFGRACLDDKDNNGSECEDPIGTSGAAGTSICLTALACELGVDPANHPAPAYGMVSHAYCGTADSMTCIHGGAAGACMAQIAAGMPAEMTQGGGLGVLQNIAKVDIPAGRAGDLVACVLPRGVAGAGCAMCFK